MVQPWPSTGVLCSGLVLPGGSWLISGWLFLERKRVELTAVREDGVAQRSPVLPGSPLPPPQKSQKRIVPRLSLSHILLSAWEGWGGGAPIMLLTLPS